MHKIPKIFIFQKWRKGDKDTTFKRDSLRKKLYRSSKWVLFISFADESHTLLWVTFYLTQCITREGLAILLRLTSNILPYSLFLIPMTTVMCSQAAIFYSFSMCLDSSLRHLGFVPCLFPCSLCIRNLQSPLLLCLEHDQTGHTLFSMPQPSLYNGSKVHT